MDFDDLNIMGNIKLIENNKTFLLSSVADLFVSLTKGSRADIGELEDELSSIIILSYLLGRRLGIDYRKLDDKILKKLKIGVTEDNDAEREFEDYSKLIYYIKNGRD